MQSTTERSKALFGNKDMLRMCAHIARCDERFTAHGLATTADVVYSTTHRLLGALTTAGLVERLPRSTAEREQWYLRKQHRFWDAACDLETEPPEVEGGGRRSHAR